MQINRILLAVLIAIAYVAVSAQQVLTGSFRMSDTTVSVFGQATADGLSKFIDKDEEVQWQVFVPETYDPGRPPGVFIYADPNGYGGMPDQYRQLFTNRNLIWIGANQSRRNPEPAIKMLKAIMAQRVIDTNYAVNLNRLYIGAAGDEAYTALNVLLRSNEFKGAIYINGSAYWSDGKPETFDYLLNKAHVFIVGSDDKRWQAVRRSYDSYKRDGIENAKLIYRSGTIRGWPDAEQMDEALAYLDAR